MSSSSSHSHAAMPVVHPESDHDYSHVSIGAARVILLESSLPDKSVLEFALPVAKPIVDDPEILPISPEFEASRPPLTSGDLDRCDWTAYYAWEKENTLLVNKVIEKCPPVSSRNPDGSESMREWTPKDYFESWKLYAGLTPDRMAEIAAMPENVRIRAGNAARRAKAKAEYEHKCAPIREAHQRDMAASATLISMALSLGFSISQFTTAPASNAICVHAQSCVHASASSAPASSAGPTKTVPGFHTWCLVRAASLPELTEDQKSALRKAIGVANRYSHIKHCSCA